MLSKPLTMLRTALVCTIPLLGAASLAQTTINVGPGQAYTTIQSGINAAVNGDTVLVAPGTYYESINFNGKAITVTSSGGAAATIINANDLAATVVFNHGEGRASILSNFTITGGRGPFISPIGGIYVLFASPTIEGNTITNNQCYGIDSLYSSPLILGNEVSYTQAPDTYPCPGRSGSAIVLGGQLSSSLGAVVQGNTIEYNTDAGLQDGVGGGGGIAVTGGYATIQSNVIRYNAAGRIQSPGGGGIGGGIDIDEEGGGVLVNNLIYGNTSSYAGGGIALYSLNYASPDVLMVNNTIVDNSIIPLASQSSVGGGAQIFYAGGTANYLNTGAYITLENNIISGSTSVASLVCYTTTESPLVYDNNDIYNGLGAAVANLQNVGICKDPTGTSGNVSVAPPFVQSSSQNYHLTIGSPTIDTGANSGVSLAASYGASINVDLDGNARIQDATNKGYAIVDMGAYEYPGVLDGYAVTETLTSTLNPSNFGDNVTFNVLLTSNSGPPTGTVQFKDGTTILGTENVSGTGTSSYATSSLAIGTHPITAAYQPTGLFTAATASLTQVVNGYVTNTTLTCVANPIYINGTAIFTANVTSTGGTPTGSIAFTDNGAALGQPSLLNGTVSLSYTGQVVGTHTIVATYVPTGAFAASTATCSEVVNQLPSVSVLTASSTTFQYGTPVVLTATVSPATPPGAGVPNGGYVQFLPVIPGGLNGGIGTLPLVNGVASGTFNHIPVDATGVTCIFEGNTIYAESYCNVIPISVSAAPTVLTLTSSLNPAPALTSVTFTAQLSLNGQAAGAGNSIILTLNGQQIYLTTNASGTATYSISTLTPGSYPVTASFTGVNYSPSSASLTQVITIDPSTLTLSSSMNPAPALTPVTFTAALTINNAAASAGQAISLSLNGQTIPLTTNANGTASYTVSTLTPGSYPVSASFAGSASIQAASASLTEVIDVLPTTTSLIVSPNPAYVSQLVTMTANVTASGGIVSSGSVTFFDGTTTLATQPVTSGSAILTISTLAVGTHPITATYSPTSADFLSSTSSVVDEVILPSGFLIALSPTTLTLAPGATGTDAILLTSVGNFAGPLALTYGTLPTYATASIDPTTVTLSAGGTGTSTLTLKTLLKASNNIPTRPGSRELPVIFTAFLLLLAPLGFGRRRMFPRILGAAFLLVSLQAITGCTNAWYTANVVAPGTYQLPITATDIHGNTQSATLTVIVTP